MPLAQWSLLLSAMAFLSFGAAFLLAPELVELTGVLVPTRDSRIEVRALHGGLELGIGLFLLLAFRRRSWWQCGLVLQVLTFGGMALGRVVGVLTEGGADLALTWGLLAAEAAGAILGGIALAKFDLDREAG